MTDRTKYVDEDGIVDIHPEIKRFDLDSIVPALLERCDRYSEGDRQKDCACDRCEAVRHILKLNNALWTYADPEFYFACDFRFDPPCGGFDEDFSLTQMLGRGEVWKPGKLAREVLGFDQRDYTEAELEEQRKEREEYYQSDTLKGLAAQSVALQLDGLKSILPEDHHDMLDKMSTDLKSAVGSLEDE